MAATTYSALIAAARFHLLARRGSGANIVDDPLWSDAELLNIALRGTTDLWAAIVDLHEEHFLTNDATNVSLASGDTSLTGVPTDTFRIYLIEPRDVSETGAHRYVLFIPRDYNHQEFINARMYPQLTPSFGTNILYALAGAGGPNGAPTVYTAPKVSEAINLRFVYIPTLGTHTYTLNTANPIPGESDHAVIAWIVAYARAKEREDRSPDPAWLAVYATEKQSLLMRMVPRQEQEPQVVDGLFDSYWRY